MLSFLFLACGSGTFEDDPKTWNKVFGEDIPKEINVIKSKFWKSTHWTYEYELFVKFECNSQFLDEYFIKRYNLSKREVFATLYFEDSPKWFIDNDREDYNVWVGKINSMTMYIHKKSNLVYLHSLQL